MTIGLFVYGTLAPGRSNHHIMRPIDGEWLNAKTHGHLKQLGWGAAEGFPAIVPDADGPEINGYLFTSEQLSEHWSRLDEFEGEEYQRVKIDVTLDDGVITQAYVYALKVLEQ